MRPVLLAIVLLALAAPAAHAAVTVSMEVSPGETRFGDPTGITGTVTDGDVPVAGQKVRLEGRRHPYDGDLRVLETTTTGDDGTYAFERRLERNWELRVTAGDAATDVVRAYVFPRFTLTYEARSARQIRVVQRYRVPHGVDLRRPTIFYAGRRGAGRAPRAARADVVRTRSGRYRSTALVRIPASWNGRFRYASCFRYTAASGMGNPRARCPKRFRF